MTSDQKQGRATLRALAKRLGCSHSALSKAANDGRLTAGIRIDSLGRVNVVDADAAAAQWTSVHVPQMAEAARRAARDADAAEAKLAELQQPGDGAEMFADLSKQDLLERWAAFDALAHALIADAVGASSDPTATAIDLLDRIGAQLRRAGNCAEVIADAEQLLDTLLSDALNPHDDEEPT